MANALSVTPTSGPALWSIYAMNVTSDLFKEGAPSAAGLGSRMLTTARSALRWRKTEMGVQR